MFFENLRWHIFENSPLTANIVASSADDDESFPHQTTWSGGNVQRANVANFGTLASQQFQFVGDNLKVGTSSGLPLKTGSGGAVEAGSFGTSAGTFCEGNDARLSDARTPSSTLAHKASHATGGTDALAPSDIGAQSLLVTNNLTLTGNTTLTAGRNILWFLDAGGGASGTYQVTLPTTGNQAGDLIEIVVGFFPSGLIVDIYEDGALAENLYNVADAVPSKRRAYRNTNGTASGWIGVVPPFHNHSASQISSGTLDVAHLPVGTGSTQVAAGNHTHGNLTNAGAIGTTANLPLKTGTNGVVEAGSFGTAAGSFCAGDDVRLSDDRDPNAHAASHLPDGADEIFDQSLNTTDSVTFLNLHIDGGDLTGVGQLAFDSGAGQSVTISEAEISFTGAAAATTLTNIGAAASGSITSSGLTQSTARILGRTTASTGAVEEIQIGSGLSLSAGELSATGSGVTAVGASTADVLSVSGSDLVADDPNADRIVFWDDSESKLRYLEAGSGLSISGTTMTVTATGGATNLWIPASAWIPKTTAGCGVDSRETTTNDQNFDELLFDTGSDEFADALVVMPSNYNNGTITARFYWTAASGSGTVEWAIQGRAFANDDALDTAAGTKQAVNDTLIAANDMHITSATSACTIGGTPAANTPIQFTIYRDVSEDTLAVDARLLGVEIIFN
jgi:hypothetical protein